MKVKDSECCLCGRSHGESKLNPDWYAEGLRHYERGDSVMRLICPTCVSDILEHAGQVLRSRAPDSVIMAMAINAMDEDGLLYVHSPIHEFKYNWKQVIASAPAETRKTTAIAILMSAGIEPVAVEGDTVVLSFRYPHHKLIMEQTANQHIADQVISNFFGRPMHVSWRQSIN